MLRLAADENFNNTIVRNLLTRLPQLDIIRIQDTKIVEAPDSTVLEWAANNDRILLTHDLKTIPPLFYIRLNNSESVPGIFAIPLNASLDQVVDDLMLLITASEVGEWTGRLLYLLFK